MFKEIAVDPAAVVTSYLQFSYIIEKFGISEGRLIAAFPSKWKRFAYQAAQAHLRGTAELSRLEVRLRSLTDDAFYAKGRPGEGCAEDWLAAAIAEHKRAPFDAIIAREPQADPLVIEAAQLDGEHACLQPNRQWHIERVAAVMANCCAPLLSSAKHIKLIDPHFDARQSRFRRPLLEFLKCVRPGTRVDVYRGNGQGDQYLIDGIEHALQGALPMDAEFRLYLLPQDALHNRYVLTQSGGMYFSTGLDDKGNGDILTDEVGVLEPAIWTVQWNKYSGDDPVACWA